MNIWNGFVLYLPCMCQIQKPTFVVFFCSFIQKMQQNPRKQYSSSSVLHPPPLPSIQLHCVGCCSPYRIPDSIFFTYPEPVFAPYLPNTKTYIFCIFLFTHSSQKATCPPQELERRVWSTLSYLYFYISIYSYFYFS